MSSKEPQERNSVEKSSPLGAPSPATPVGPAPASGRAKIIFGVKILISAGILVWIYSKVVRGADAKQVWAHVASISLPWVGIAFAASMAAVTFGIFRWRLLLQGQGIYAPWRHLIGAYFIGRFFGGFLPSNLGLDGYKLYDIARHTGRLARSSATIAVEKLLGIVGLGCVVIVGSLLGLKHVGWAGVGVVMAAFAGAIIGSLAILFRPGFVRSLSDLLPALWKARVQTLVDAVCAYEGKGLLLLSCAALAAANRICGVFIYIAISRALGANIALGDVFFVTAMQTVAALMPVSINGMGVREATAAGLYKIIGVDPIIALLIPTAGFLTEMLDRPIGGLVFLLRRVGYVPAIRVEDAEREELAAKRVQELSLGTPIGYRYAIGVGFIGGLLGGALLSLLESAVILSGGAGDLGVLSYGIVFYGLLFAAVGTFAGGGVATLVTVARKIVASVNRRSTKSRGARALDVLATGLILREATRATSIATVAALFIWVPGTAIAMFRIRRDVFEEMLKWSSARGLGVAAACLVTGLIVFFGLRAVFAVLIRSKAGACLSLIWGAPLLVGVLAATTYGLRLAFPSSATVHAPVVAKSAAPTEAGNILVIVIDTLRADHLPLYGYAKSKTPNLDAFGKDAVVYEQHFANASWTRPSFASLLTGRYASSHGAMSKAAALSDDLETLAEAFGRSSYQTGGVVTNYNVAPFFNFQQGFGDYTYLAPNFVLGANDTAAKLLFVQFARQRIESMRARTGRVEPGSAYQDATAVNKTIYSWLEQKPKAPWFYFAAYMDPHDPYYPHPYDGTGYSRAANQKPKPEEADLLRELYDGEMEFWDAEFGNLIADLKARGLYEQLTIVITSDHGEEFCEHGGFWHGTTLYDEQIRVPLLVKRPFSSGGGTRVSHWTQSIDIMPTLLSMSGIEIPKGVQGKQLDDGHDEVFAEESHEQNVLQSLRVRRGDSELKVIHANAGNPRGLQEVELYRVDQDPGERVNLSHEQPELPPIVVPRLLNAQKAARTGAVKARSVNLETDQSSMDRLRALGYAQ